MISILAPSKTLNFETSAPEWVRPTNPQFIETARSINEKLRQYSSAELAQLMSVSIGIAETNHQRYMSWGDEKKPALWAYRGDVYKGMYADQLSGADSVWAESHLRIMSGLYGILRPSDEVSPYRLEMKAKVSIGDAKDLYMLWGSDLAAAVDEVSDDIICNLSSDEYAKPVTKYTNSRVVTPVFMDHKPNGTIGPVPIYSKMMRGVMARWIIDHRVDHPDQLVTFDRFGYLYDASRSSPDAPVFVRAIMKPLVF